MVTLTEAQISRIGKLIGYIDESIGKLQGYVTQYGLDGSTPTDPLLLDALSAVSTDPKSGDAANPSDYPEFTALLERQKIALNHLLEHGEIGCELDSLQFRESTMTTSQHLHNLQFLSLKTKGVPEAEREEFMDRALKQDLHDLKGLSSTADLVYENIQKILAPPKLGGGDKKPEWNR